MLFMSVIMFMVFVIMSMLLAMVMPIFFMCVGVFVAMVVMVIMIVGVRMLFFMLMRVVVTFVRMIVAFESTPLTQFVLHDLGRFHERDCLRVLGMRFKGVHHEGFHRRPNPENQIGFLQRTRFGRTHGIGVWRSCTGEKKIGLADTFHKRSGQRVYRLD